MAKAISAQQNISGLTPWLSEAADGDYEVNITQPIRMLITKQGNKLSSAPFVSTDGHLQSFEVRPVQPQTTRQRAGT